MRKYSVRYQAGISGVCLALLSPFSPVNAQSTSGATEIYEIIVTAPRMTVQETRRVSRGGARVSMSFAVGYADLDLARPDSRSELEERVRLAAEEICDLLTERYPGSQTSASACTRQALRDAMAQVREAIETASR